MFKGTTNYRKQLIGISSSDDEIYQAWKQAHDDFQQCIETIKQVNIDIIERNELINRAEGYLRVNKLKAGMLVADDRLTDQENYQYHLAQKDMLEQSGIFDELFDNAAKDHYEGMGSFVDIDNRPSAHLEVQHYAWKLISEPVNNNKTRYLFSDCWPVYAAKKGLDEAKRNTKRIKACFFKFIAIAGDHIINEHTVDDALVSYVAHREAERDLNSERGNKPSPSPSSIERELNTILAILRVGIKKYRLKVTIERPEIREDLSPIVRHTFSADELIELVNIASDQDRRDYQSYKELMMLLMVQTGTHITELLRLTRDRVILEHSIPHIILDGELKTAQRKRVIPLVFKVERIKGLSALFEDDSVYFFGEINAKRTADNYSNQLNKICKQVNPNGTSYSCRHSFKHHALARGIDAQVMAILGGWSGKDMSLSRQMLGYASSGLLNEESLLRLQDAMLQINQHFINEEVV
ncbi:MAG: tyrosine-type recombinase/integrase [Methylophagaceae bacterium]